MKRAHVVLAMAALAMSACATRSAPPGVQRPPDTVCRKITVDTAFDEERACPEWRKIAVAGPPGSDCPEPAPFRGESWRVTPVFDTPPPSSLPAALRSFCIYETSATDAGVLAGLNANLETLVVQGRLARVDSSCAAVSTAASGLTSTSWRLLSDHFLSQAGRVDLTAVSPPAGAAVRLALIDTQPGERAEPGNSEHGYTLERLTRQLLCTWTDCSAHITSHLGLPIVDFDRDQPEETEIDMDRGGFYGSVDQLAAAVWRALEDSRDASEDRLVLNLSVAWEGARFGGLEPNVEDMPAPVQALYRVLEVASCRGALVLAAAGNRKGGFDEQEGPLLPGGWERRAAPSAADCARIDADAVVAAPDGGEPLVYAAGAVRTSGSPVANARASGEPPRVAYGDHAVAPAGDGDGPTGILTGSSVATAVVSATAAAVWRLWPDLDGSQVMDLLYESGSDLGRTAGFHHGPADTPPGVRRIALCPAVASACAGSGICRPPVCPEIPATPPRLSTLSLGCQTASLADSTFVDAARIDADLGDAPLCKSRQIRFDSRSGPPTDPCPVFQYFGVQARPWSHPQPTTNPCSGCGIDPPPDNPSMVADDPGTPRGHRLHIEIDPDWRGGVLREAFLDVGDLSFALDLKPLDAGDCATVGGIAPELLAPSDGGLDPPVVLRFRVEPAEEDGPVASVEVPVLVGG